MADFFADFWSTWYRFISGDGTLQFNSELVENSLTTNRSNMEFNLQPIVDAIAQMDITVSVVDINDGIQRVARIKEIASTR